MGSTSRCNCQLRHSFWIANRLHIFQLSFPFSEINWHLLLPHIPKLITFHVWHQKVRRHTIFWYNRDKTLIKHFQGYSDQISCSVVSDSLQPHESQHARPPCPSPTPGVHSDSRPSSRWCHPAISSSVVPFSSCPQSLPASESFPMSQLFAKAILVNSNCS